MISERFGLNLPLEIDDNISFKFAKDKDKICLVKSKVKTNEENKVIDFH